MPASLTDQLPRHSLGFYPTPIHRLERLSDLLGGPQIYIKRDDQTGLALGGNKTRKLEFLLGDALSQGCDTLVTAGAMQSNHCRQTAAAAAACGLDCHLVLGGEQPSTCNGNLLLDLLLGAQIHWCGPNRKGEDLPEIVEQIRAQGRKPYVVPYGGSNPIGAAGFAEAWHELRQQSDEMGVSFSHIVIASSSGGTQAGLLVGREFYGDQNQIIGIAIDKIGMDGQPFADLVRQLANDTSRLLNLDKVFAPADINVVEDFLDADYGEVGESERSAIHTLATVEGILLDPVYTGRAMHGLLELVRGQHFSKDDNVLFWHTGGTPALFSHADEVQKGR